MANAFTPEQIAQILEEFFKTVGARQYIGARYVPIFGRKDEESIEWDNTKPYEPLTIVLYLGNSYTSRQYVPAGVQITDDEFWALTGNYNAQVEQYRRETARALQAAQNAQTSADNAQNDINVLLPKSDFSSENTVKDYIDSAVQEVQNDVQEVQNDIDTLLPKSAFSAESTVKDYIDAQDEHIESLLHVEAPKVLYHANGFDVNSESVYHCVKFSKETFELAIVPSETFSGGNGIPAYIDENKPTLLFNGLLGRFILSQGTVIGEQSTSDTLLYYYICAIDSDNQVTLIPDFDVTRTASEIKNLGYRTAFKAWAPVMVNGSAYDWENNIPARTQDEITQKQDLFEDKHSRQVLAWDDDWFYVLSVEGQMPYSKGATFDELASICQTCNLTNAFNMDGGGSVQTWVSNPTQNLVYQSKESGWADPRRVRNNSMFVITERV